MDVERMEYGDAIGYPVALVTAEGRFAADDPRFVELLRNSVEEANRRRAEIERNRKRAIGDNSEQLQKVTQSRTAAERKGDTAQVQSTTARLEQTPG
jgi:hypothetical protein